MHGSHASKFGLRKFWIAPSQYYGGIQIHSGAWPADVSKRGHDQHPQKVKRPHTDLYALKKLKNNQFTDNGCINSYLY